MNLTAEEIEALRRITRQSTAPQAQVMRAQIILLCGEGLSSTEVSERTGVSQQCVSRWRTRFVTHRMQGLADLPRSGPPRKISDEKVAEVIRLTLESKPENASHWSTRKMAAKAGISNERVARIWQSFGLKPHRQESFQLSTDPFFVEKVRDVVGLYMSPPENALVLCVDEKSQIQALERSQPVLPLMPGRAERQTHDYFRHGTTTLFAALNVKTGQVLSHCHQRHTHKEFLAFLRKIESSSPKGIELHLVLDNYATHKTPAVRKWLSKRPNWHLHFIPTHSSWLNQVERFFAKITTERIRRDSFTSLAALKAAIETYIQAHNQNPKPFSWTASAEAIFARITKYCTELA